MNEDIINSLLDLIGRLKEDISIMEYQAKIYDETIKHLNFVNKEMKACIAKETADAIERRWDEKKKLEKEVPF